MGAQTPPAAPRHDPESAPDAGSDAADLPLDVVFELLANRRRRIVLDYLRSDSGTTTLGDLAEHIASLENDKPTTALSSAERKRVYICLYQSHLPKMDHADVIDFDGDRKTVEPGEHIDHLTAYLPERRDVDADGRGGGLTDTVAALAGTIGRVAGKLGSRGRE